MSKEIEIEYEFDPVEYNGKKLYAMALPAFVEYSTQRDSWDYPLASAGTRYEDTVEIEWFELVLSIVDENGDTIYEEDDEVPDDLRSIYNEMFDKVVEELVQEMI
jgi:hypothetical protein